MIIRFFNMGEKFSHSWWIDGDTLFIAWQIFDRLLEEYENDL